MALTANHATAVALAEIILKGYDTGSREYQIPMPIFGNDPSLSDEDIVDLISYLNSTYAMGWSGLDVDSVKMIRDSRLE